MADLATLSFQIDSRPLRTATGELRSLGEQGQRTARATDQLADSANRAPRATDRLALSLRGVAGAAAAAYGAFASVRAIYDATEAYTGASNALRGIGLSAGQASAALNDISGIATRTRAPLDATAQLYQRITVASRDLGASQADVSRFVENVGLALATSGTSANAASGALLQLSQAMSGGKVQAEEFNSVLENAFPVAQAAADAIDAAGGSVGRLRALVVEGEISSKQFFDAILSSTDALEAAFGATVPTISQAMTVLGTAFTMTVGSMNQLMGASGGVAQAMIVVAENMDRIIVYAGTAAVAFGTTYVGGLVAAAVATHGLSGALGLLKRALFATGIGALVVIAGELAYQFLNLAQKAGGFGKALSLLGSVATEVSQRMGQGWSYVSAMAKVAAAETYSWFATKLTDISIAFTDMTWSIATAMNSVFGTALTGVDAALQDSMKLTERAAQEGAAAAGQAADAAKEGLLAPLESVQALINHISSMSTETDAATSAVGGLTGALDGNGGTSGAAGKAAKSVGGLSEAAKAAKQHLDDLKSSAEAWTDRVATPVEKYRKEIAGLNEVATAGLIGDETYARGIKALNVELADSLPLVGELTDTISEGLFDGFKGTLDSITSIFKRWLAQMISTAAKNQIVTYFTPQMGGASGIGGMMGGMGSVLGSLGSAFMGGASSFLSTGFGGLGATLAGATSSLTGFAAAAGALALPIAGAVAAFDFFRTKTKKLDQGIRLTTEGMSTAVEQWERIRKTRFWGLSTDTDNYYSDAPKSIASPMERAVRDIQAGVVEAADALGVGRSAFRDFSHEIRLSTKGMTEEEAVKAVQEEMAGLGNAFARMVPGVRSLRMEGESAADALTRTATTLTTVNAAFKTLGFDQLDESLKGGKTANRLVEMSGGLQQFATATEFYFQNIMSAPDRLKALTAQFRESLDAGGIVNMPTSTKGFQTQVGKLMDTGALNKATALINLAPLFQQIQQLQGELDTTGDKASTAAERLAAREKKAADIASERAGLEEQLFKLTATKAEQQRAELQALFPANRELQRRINAIERETAAAERAAARQEERAGLQTQIWQLLGMENKLREQALAELAPMNRAMQERIWRIEDEQAATEKANAIAEERLGIQRQIWSLTGNTTAIERDLLASLDPANRALQQQVFALEKQAEAASKASAIADERTSLEDRLLQLQGNTAEIRRRELAGLDATNRSLQLMIYGLEDAAQAMEDLDPAAFATKLDYERARARAVSGVGGVTSTGVPLAVVPQTGAQSVQQRDAAELLKVAKELLTVAKQERALAENIERDTRRHTQIAVRQDEEARAKEAAAS